MKHLTAFNVAFVVAMLSIVMMMLLVVSTERVAMPIYFGVMALLMLAIMKLETPKN